MFFKGRVALLELPVSISQEADGNADEKVAIPAVYDRYYYESQPNQKSRQTRTFF
jgi:hypothetical protein